MASSVTTWKLKGVNLLHCFVALSEFDQHAILEFLFKELFLLIYSK